MTEPIQKIQSLLITPVDYDRIKPFIKAKMWRIRIGKQIINGEKLKTLFKKETEVIRLFRIALFNKMVKIGDFIETYPMITMDSNYNNSEVKKIFDEMLAAETEFNTKQLKVKTKNETYSKFNYDYYFNRITIEFSKMFLRGIGYVKMLLKEEPEKLLKTVKNIQKVGVMPEQMGEVMLALINNAAEVTNAVFDQMEADEKAEVPDPDADKNKKSWFDKFFGPTQIVIAEPVKFVLVQDTSLPTTSLKMGGKRMSRHYRKNKNHRNQNKSRRRL